MKSIIMHMWILLQFGTHQHSNAQYIDVICTFTIGTKIDNINKFCYKYFKFINESACTFNV
jgi:hypothetical protein